MNYQKKNDENIKSHHFSLIKLKIKIKMKDSLKAKEIKDSLKVKKAEEIKDSLKVKKAEEPEDTAKEDKSYLDSIKQVINNAVLEIKEYVNECDKNIKENSEENKPYYK